ncbi:hypothetical protein L2E82_02590 [Cichorium intybus]|uniref:Uncharacterized protein n=1 Tax=Cichorium intybus TaxID=13427 RepID=A0ACB9H2Q6_CICIN|nr:hypothetical protein L2E82_02590 [Cichorium intybus]
MNPRYHDRKVGPSFTADNPIFLCLNAASKHSKFSKHSHTHLSLLTTTLFPKIFIQKPKVHKELESFL